MAGFKTHVSVSSGLGLIFGTVGYACGLPPSTALVGAGLCAIGGMLPDLDGDTGVAVREIVPLIAAVVPALMIDLFKQWGLDREGIFLAIMGIYFLIRFGIGIPFTRLTRHRGMWHSIPAAINVGLIVFLICSYQDLGPRSFKSVAITLGFLSHLVLDEIWSLDGLRVKQSAGTAFKFFTRKRIWPNILTYGILIGLCTAIYTTDSTLKQEYHAWKAGELDLSIKPDWNRLVFSPNSDKVEPALPQPKEF